IPSATSFQLYSEDSVNEGIQSGLAVMNPSDSSITIVISATNTNGSPLGSEIGITIPGRGQTSFFLNEIPEFIAPSKSVVRISSSPPISVMSLRSRYNERGDLLITPLPPLPANAIDLNDQFFPYFVDGGGYSTEFIVFGGPSSSTLLILSASGQLVNPF